MSSSIFLSHHANVRAPTSLTPLPRMPSIRKYLHIILSLLPRLLQLFLLQLSEKTPLTLNAFISILSKMAGAALLLPVSEALGQLKWSWFLEHSKQTWDFEIFDNASRGPWGSMLLLIRTKAKALAALRAMIMLASLALDPFFQQVVDFPDRWALQNTSSAIPRAVQYKPPFIPAFFGGLESTSEDRSISAVGKEFFYGNLFSPFPTKPKNQPPPGWI
jgi:hypothetical protein